MAMCYHLIQSPWRDEDAGIISQRKPTKEWKGFSMTILTAVNCNRVSRERKCWQQKKVIAYIIIMPITEEQVVYITLIENI